MKRIPYLSHFIGVVVLSAIVISSAIAQDKDEETSLSDDVSDVVDDIFGGWSGNATLGATNASGNSEASNINGAIRLSKTVGRWEHLAFGSIFKGTSAIIVEERDDQGELVLGDDGQPVRSIIKGDNSNRLAIGFQPRYYWRERTYFFGLIDYEQDKPANIKLGSRQIIGVGHKFYANDSGFLSGEVGFGNKNTDLESGNDLNGGIGYVGLNYLNRISENVTFNADLRSDFGSDNTYLELGLGVAFKLSEKFALKLSHFSRNNSGIDTSNNPFGSSSDSVTTMNLVIDI